MTADAEMVRARMEARERVLENILLLIVSGELSIEWGSIDCMGLVWLLDAVLLEARNK